VLRNIISELIAADWALSAIREDRGAEHHMRAG